MRVLNIIDSQANASLTRYSSRIDPGPIKRLTATQHRLTESLCTDKHATTARIEQTLRSVQVFQLISELITIGKKCWDDKLEDAAYGAFHQRIQKAQGSSLCSMGGLCSALHSYRDFQLPLFNKKIFI